MNAIIKNVTKMVWQIKKKTANNSIKIKSVKHIFEDRFT